MIKTIDFMGNNDLYEAISAYCKFKSEGIELIKLSNIDNTTNNVLIVDLHDKEIVKSLGKHLTRTGSEEIPFIVIVGLEDNLNDYDKYINNPIIDDLSPIRLMTHACGKRYFKYFSLPAQISALISFILHDKKPLKNPFKHLSEMVNDLPTTIKDPFEDFIIETGRFTDPDYRRMKRMKVFHDDPDRPKHEMQYYDYVIAYLKYQSSLKNEPFNILVIDNKPGGVRIKSTDESNKPDDSIIKGINKSLRDALKDIENIFKGYKFWLVEEKKHFSDLKNHLTNFLQEKNSKDHAINERAILSKIKNTSGEDEDSKPCRFNDIDLILIDLFLEEDDMSGIDFLHLFTLLYPQIPAFILSNSEDPEMITKTIKEKADNYILKKCIYSMPFIYYDYIEQLGRLVDYIEDKDLKRNLIGNLRYWRFKKEFIWFGDKCYHMINHSFNHTNNNWLLANQILPHIIDYIEQSEQQFYDEDIYVLSMAIWLHDLGHKGNEHYGEPHEIRDLHGLISGEIIMKHPESYGIFGYSEQEGCSCVSPYRWASFSHHKTALESIRERLANIMSSCCMMTNVNETTDINRIYKQVRRLTILEKIALLCIFHKSNFPLDEKDILQFGQKGKRIPLDCYINNDQTTSPIHLKSLTDILIDDNFIRLMALFRFIDGLDINENRVGDGTEEAVKKETIFRDIEYQKLKLKREVESLIEINLRESNLEKRFFNLFYERPVQDLEKNTWISDDLKKEQRLFLDTLRINLPLENYYTLLEYIEFLSVQDGHFGLHNSIISVDIQPMVLPVAKDGLPCFKVSYKSSKRKEQLESDDIKVKIRGEKDGKSIRNHLLGFKDKEKIEEGYVRKELNNGKIYLKEWFEIDSTEIIIKTKDDKTEEETRKK